MKPKILIVGTIPYNNKSTSRAFESYFNSFDKDNLAQIFSNTKKPTKGHCSTLFQITDQRLVLKRFNPSIEIGMIYNYDDLSDTWTNNSLEVENIIFTRLYKWGSNKTPLKYLLRKYIWNKKYWCSKKLNNWLDEFRPDCVFLSFSDDFFIPEIALYVAKRFNVPIISSIGDDYFFNSKFSFSPLYYLYKTLYKNTIRDVFNHKGSAIYICDKIKSKYNSYFHIEGKTVYLSSTIKRRDFRKIDVERPKISYFGNIRLGRNYSLLEIGNALSLISKKYVLNIYSNENESRYSEIFSNHENIIYHGSIPYEEVQAKTLDSDIIVVVEGFDLKDINITRYSLSTKIADCLASGSNILAFGSIQCAAIEYLDKMNCATVCTEKLKLAHMISYLIDNEPLQSRNYIASSLVYEKNHNIENSSNVFNEVLNDVMIREEIC